MLYSELTLHHGMERLEGVNYFVFLGNGRIEDKKERDKLVWEKSS
jgi:hypothetical protein